MADLAVLRLGDVRRPDPRAEERVRVDRVAVDGRPRLRVEELAVGRLGLAQP